jgi:hypothetical protein
MKIKVTKQHFRMEPPRPFVQLGVEHDLSTPEGSRYIVVDKQLFFLAVIKYGITYETGHKNCSM